MTFTNLFASKNRCAVQNNVQAKGTEIKQKNVISHIKFNVFILFF